jgi:dipeptidyl aminopeptidase/acylaminoacyl peptidase
MPPPEIQELADAKPIPAVSIQPRSRSHVLYLHHSPMLTLEDVSGPVLKLAGARFNPCTLSAHGTSGMNLYHTAIEVQDVASQEVRQVALPEGARLEHMRWSPDGSKLAFSLRTSEVEDDAVGRLWVLDVASAHAAPAEPEQRLNGVLGSPFAWLPDSCSLVLKRPVGTRADEPASPAVPTSPSVQTAAGGKRAAVRTYPHLLSSEADAARFRHYTTVQLVRLTLGDGGAVTDERAVGAPAIAYGMQVRGWPRSGRRALVCRALVTPRTTY